MKHVKLVLSNEFINVELEPWKDLESYSLFFSHFSSQMSAFLFTSVNFFLLRIIIMCGYQCDKAVTKNDTCEVIYHFTAVK